jgi:hypothetical protein
MEAEGILAACSKGQVAWCRSDLVFRGTGVFSQRSFAGGKYLVTRLEAGYFFTNFLYMTGTIPPKDIVIRFGKSNIKTSQPWTPSHREDVARVNARCVDANQHVIFIDLWLINFLEFEYFWSSVCVQDDRLHCYSPFPAMDRLLR